MSGSRKAGSLPDAPATGEGVYEVFARYRLNDDLAHIGSVRASNVTSARAYAHFLFRPHRSWAEICMVPHEAVIPLDDSRNSRRLEVV